MYFSKPSQGINFKTQSRRGLKALLVLSCCLFCTALAASDADLRINKVKAAFVLNIARFVSWPDEPSGEPKSRYLLCLYRSNPLGEAVDSIQGQTISGGRLTVATVQGLNHHKDCAILFIPQQELRIYEQEVSAELRQPLLTILDLTSEGANTGKVRTGVMVGLAREGPRITLEVDLRQTRKAGLGISSQLLKLARILDDGRQP